jgi:tripartite-type tricarboxylate transporter receptor subunit TctC
MPLLPRRRLLAITLVTFGAGKAQAQAYPNRPIRVVVPFAAGAGVLDIMARLVGQHLGASLGQQLVIDNRPAPAASLARKSWPRPTPTATRS